MNWLNAYGDKTKLNAYNSRFLTQAPEEARENTKPTAFQGMGDAVTKAAPAAFYQTTSGFYDLLSFKLEQGLETEDAFDANDYSDAQQKAAEQMAYYARIDRKKVLKDYTPNPDTTGMASQIFYGGLRMALKAAGYTVLSGGNPVVGAVPFGADMGIYSAGELRDKGVDAKTAAMAGWAEGVGSTVGLALPASVGSSYLASMGFGAVSNAAMTVAQEGAINYVLEQADYKDVAAEFDPFNGVNLATSAVVGGAFGALGARSARAMGAKVESSDNKVLNAISDKTKDAFNALGDTKFAHKIGEVTAPAREKTVKISHDLLDATMEVRSALIHHKDQLVGKVGSVARSLRHEKTARDQIDEGKPVNVDNAEIDPELLMEQVGKVTQKIKEEIEEITGGKYHLDTETGTVVPKSVEETPVKPKKKQSRKKRKAEKLQSRKEEQKAEEKGVLDSGNQDGVDLAVKELNEGVQKIREEFSDLEMRELQEELRAEQQFQEQQSLPDEKRETLKNLAPELPETATLRPDEVKSEVKPDEVVSTRPVESEEAKLAPEETSTVAQILNGIIEDAPLPDDAKAAAKEIVAEQHNMFGEVDAAQRTLDEPPAEHPRKGVFTPEQALDNKVDKMLEEQPDMYIVDENGNQIAVADYLEDAQAQAKADTEFAQAIGEGGACMWQQGALDF